MHNFDVSCFIIGTTLPNRQENMINTMKSIDKENFLFKTKILSLDDFGEGLSKEVESYVSLNEWKLIIEKREGMVKNQIRALQHIDTEWVLYCEDDVIIEKIPKVEQINKLLSYKNKAGIISFNGGGYNAYNDRNFEKIIHNLKNEVIDVGEDEVFWFRDPLLANEWFFEFPVMMVKKEILSDCIKTSLENFKNIQIEQSYTKSYFYLNFDKKYEKYTWSRNFKNHINLENNLNINEILNFICNNCIYMKLNSNKVSASVGSGYLV
jgi:hypothetical protein